MYSQAVGFNPSGRLLSGLSKKPDAGAFAKGKAMADASGLAMDREQKNQELGMQQMQQQSQQRQQESANSARRAGNESQERMQGAEMDNRRNTFNIGMNFDYASLRRRNQLNLQQSLLNNAARDF